MKKSPLFLFALVFTAGFSLLQTSCKKEEEPQAETDWRKAYVGFYIGTTHEWVTNSQGATTGPVTTEDTVEIKLGPYPDKFRIDEVIYQVDQASMEFHQYVNGVTCDSLSGNFSSGSLSMQRYIDCSGGRTTRIFLGTTDR